MYIKRLRSSATAIFKTINNLNPNFTRNIFTSKLSAEVQTNDTVVNKHNLETLELNVF